MQNERLSSKVSYLESKYISSVLDFEKAKVEISLLKQKDKLTSILLPRDYGESVGLFLDFVMLFTRLKSKCLLLCGVLQLHQDLKNHKNAQKIDHEQLVVKIDLLFVRI